MCFIHSEEWLWQVVICKIPANRFLGGFGKGGRAPRPIGKELKRGRNAAGCHVVCLKSFAHKHGLKAKRFLMIDHCRFKRISIHCLVQGNLHLQQLDCIRHVSLNSMKLLIPLHFISWKKTPSDAVTPRASAEIFPGEGERRVSENWLSFVDFSQGVLREGGMAQWCPPPVCARGMSY